MGHPAVAFGRRAISTPGFRHYLEPDPLCTKDLERPGDHAVYSQYVETPVPVQGFICLLEIQEYLMDDHLPIGS